MPPRYLDVAADFSHQGDPLRTVAQCHVLGEGEEILGPGLSKLAAAECRSRMPGTKVVAGDDRARRLLHEQQRQES